MGRRGRKAIEHEYNFTDEASAVEPSCICSSHPPDAGLVATVVGGAAQSPALADSRSIDGR